jgi:hypothetical protein
MYVPDAVSPVPSENNTVANMYHTQAMAYRVTVASSAPEGHSRNYSHSHVTRTLVSHPFTLGNFAGGSKPMNPTTLSRHVDDSTWPVMGHPLIGNPRITATSATVIVISSHDRWKDSVFGLHLSTITVMAVVLNTGMTW